MPSYDPERAGLRGRSPDDSFVIHSTIQEHLPETRRLCTRFRVRRLLFGSATTPRFDPATSDIDLLVDFEELEGGTSMPTSACARLSRSCSVCRWEASRMVAAHDVVKQAIETGPSGRRRRARASDAQSRSPRGGRGPKSRGSWRNFRGAGERSGERGSSRGLVAEVGPSDGSASGPEPACCSRNTRARAPGGRGTAGQSSSRRPRARSSAPSFTSARACIMRAASGLAKPSSVAIESQLAPA